MAALRICARRRASPRGHKVSAKVSAMVVPGSQQVKAQAEAEGLDRVFREAGFEWREPGCSMCLGMNPDILLPGERCASTSNRNFEGPAGTRRAHASGFAGDGRGGRDCRALCGHSQLGGEGLMEPFRTLTALAAPLDRANVDTDQIIPKQFLKRIERTGYGDFLFFDWRQTPDGEPDPEFCPQRSALQGREDSHRGQELRLRIEPRARRVGAERFRLPRGHRADLRRHLLLECGQERDCAGAAELRQRLIRCSKTHKKIPNYQLTVSLEAQTVTDGRGFSAKFEIDPFRKFCLLEGLDDIGLTLRHAAALDKFETKHDEAGWLKAK